jgi:tetratricopeptide (TPR) repeat protein
MPKTYKIQITPERTIGPIDMERVKALVMKGRIQGHEPTAEPPFTDWRPFTSFPGLGELLLKKLESDENRADAGEVGTPEIPATKTMVSTEATKTMAEDSIKVEHEEEFGIPTLIDIPMLPKEENPDLERTRADLPVLDARGLPVSEDSTRILTPESMEIVAQQYTPPAVVKPPPGIPQKNIFGKEVDAAKYVDEKGRRRLFTPRTMAILAFAVVFVGYLATSDEETAKKNDPANIVPRIHTFPYIEVNVPPRLGNTIEAAESAELVEKGQELTQKETPSAYITAIKKYLYRAVGKNVTSWDAKAVLASAYMRISEIVPRDQRFFDTVDKLLFPGPPKTQWTPEYVVALSEYYQMLNRHDQAQEIIDTYLKRTRSNELYYQKARIDFERREIDSALSNMSKAIPPENAGAANPRHLLFYATLLDKKGQTEAAIQNLNRLKKESASRGLYGPGILFHADLLHRNGKSKEARAVLKPLLDRPYLVDRVQLADAFALAAKILESLNDLPRARAFADTAENFHYDKEAVQDLLYRIKSKIPKTKAAYTQIVAGRQKEKAKQDDQAQILYTRALEMDRGDPTPFMLLANLYEQQGLVAEAVERYQRAVSGTDRRPVWAYLNLARIYANRFDLENAKNMIKMASSLKRERDAVEYLQGLVNLKASRQDLAEPFFDKAMSRNSRLTDLYIQMGDIEVEKKNQKLAEFYYSVALRYQPFHPKAMLGVALTRFYLDSPSGAKSFLKDKLAMQPNSAAIMSNLAIIHLRSGDQDSGKAYLQNAIRSDSKYAQAFRLLGDLTKDEGDRQVDNYAARRYSYRYALASYEMYCKLAPNDPEGYKATADLYFDIRDLGAAAKNYHTVLKLTKNYPGVRLRLAQISRNGGDAANAMKLLDEEIQINPRSDAALVERGNVYMAQKDFQNATKAFTDAARINEKNADALFGLGVVYHLQSSYDNALSLFARVIKLDPLKADVYWQMGLIYQKQNNKAKAIQAFTNYKGIVRDPMAMSKADEKLRELQK